MPNIWEALMKSTNANIIKNNPNNNIGISGIFNKNNANSNNNKYKEEKQYMMI